MSEEQQNQEKKSNDATTRIFSKEKHKEYYKSKPFGTRWFFKATNSRILSKNRKNAVVYSKSLLSGFNKKKEKLPEISWNEAVDKYGFTLEMLNKQYKSNCYAAYACLAVILFTLIFSIFFLKNSSLGLLFYFLSLPMFIIMILAWVKACFNAWRFKHKNQADFGVFLSQLDLFPNPFYKTNNLYKRKKKKRSRSRRTKKTNQE